MFLIQKLTFGTKSIYSIEKNYLTIFFFLGIFIFSFNSYSQETDSNEALNQEEAEAVEELESVASNQTVRRFHEVLEELLAEFSYDVKNGQMGEIKNLSIRKVRVSDTLPLSYVNYIELLVAERIRENSRLKLISCLPCKSKNSRFVDGKFIISSPISNVSDLDRAATRFGIEYFLDVVMIYHTTHMVLAFQIFNSGTKEMVWSRSYNSETVRSRYQKLAIDYSQVSKSRDSDEYVPEYRYMMGVGGAAIPNVAGEAKDSSMLSVHFRATEKFNNRKYEFGLLTNLYATTSSILSEYPATKATSTDAEEDEVVLTEDQPEPFTSAIGLSAIFTYNLLSRLESFDQIRNGFNLAGGALITSGYLAITTRVGADIYFGKKWNIAIGGIYIFPSNITIGTNTVSTTGGAGGEFIVAYSL